MLEVHYHMNIDAENMECEESSPRTYHYIMNAYVSLDVFIRIHYACTYPWIDVLLDLEGGKLQGVVSTSKMFPQHTAELSNILQKISGRAIGELLVTPIPPWGKNAAIRIHPTRNITFYK